MYSSFRVHLCYFKLHVSFTFLICCQITSAVISVLKIFNFGSNTCIIKVEYSRALLRSLLKPDYYSCKTDSSCLVSFIPVSPHLVHMFKVIAILNKIMPAGMVACICVFSLVSPYSTFMY